MSVFVLAVGVVLAVPVLRLLLGWWRKMTTISGVPGPPALPLIGNFLDIRRGNFNMTKIIEEWTIKYKDIFQMSTGARRVVFIGKPEDLEILLSSNIHIKKSKNYDLFREWIGDGLLTSTGQKWKLRRKLITPSFHFAILDQFVEVFNRNTDILVDKLLKVKDVLDVFKLVNLCSLDIICEAAMGTSVEAQKNSNSNYVQAVADACFSLHTRSIKPWLNSKLIFDLSHLGKVHKSAVTSMHQYTQNVIETRKTERTQHGKSSQTEDDGIGRKRRAAFLDLLLDASETSGANLTDQEIQEEVETFMFEGHDTTSSAISFALYAIAAHPQVQESIVKEMQDIFGESDRPPTVSDLQQMHYLERVIKESLRLYPSVPHFGRTVVMEDLHLTDGVVIPKGCDITISCRMTHRNPRHWPDPDKFDPDRFLPENTVGRHPFAFIPFSAGPRNCVGQKFAMLEMKSAVSKVVRRCVLDVPEPGYEPEIRSIIILRAPEGVKVRVSPRH